MKILNAKQQLKELELDPRIADMWTLGDRCFKKNPETGKYDLLKDRENERTHLKFTLNKKHLTLELMVIDGQIVCSISTTKSFTQDLVNGLVDRLLINGFDTWEGHKDSDRNPRFSVGEGDPLTILFAMKDFIESDNELEDSNTSVKSFAFNTLDEYLEFAVETYRLFVGKATRMLGREFFDNDKIRSWITQNSYNKNTGLIWFEHLVPIIYISTTLESMMINGASNEECIVWLKKNLIGRYITNSQAKWLDTTAGLKTTMPEGQEDNPNARYELLLKEGIE